MDRDWERFVQRHDFSDLAPLAQSLFLQDAMDRMGMEREALAKRIGVSKKCLAKWMTPHGASEFRQMPEMAWKFISEVMQREQVLRPLCLVRQTPFRLNTGRM